MEPLRGAAPCFVPGSAPLRGVLRLHVAALRLEGGAVLEELVDARAVGLVLRGEVVRLLLDAGASASAEDMDGLDAAAWAEEGGHEALVAVLGEGG